MTALRIVSVTVGQPKTLHDSDRWHVVSSIDKQPATAERLRLTTTNLEGDQQADMRPTPSGQPVHGGEHQAVYAYPHAHHPRLAEILGHEPPPGYMGENVTVDGATEHDVCIGDTWSWGSATLQVTAPRGPCYKLGLRMGKQALRKVVREEGLVGWYLRVLVPGEVPTAGEIEVVHRDPAGITVAAVHSALQRRHETFPDIAAHAALTPNLKRALMVRDRDVVGSIPEAD